MKKEVDLISILAPVQSDLEEFEESFLTGLQPRVELMNQVVQYVATHRGKRLRPALVFLVARMLGKLDRQGIETAQIIELIHTATLIHDDVVDEAEMRRGADSVNFRWSNRISILVGDYLFAYVLNKIMTLNNPAINTVLARVTTRMSEGELLQIQQSQNLQLDEASYFQMISDKTASLIAAACQVGAIVGSNHSGKIPEWFWQFGNDLGCAFQIQDDLLDYIGNQNLTGKPVGNDLKENKITLPLIYAMHRNGTYPKDRLRKLLSGAKSDEIVAEIRDLVILSGGVEHAQQKANTFVERALQVLSHFEENIYKQSLAELVQFAAVRNN